MQTVVTNALMMADLTVPSKVAGKLKLFVQDEITQQTFQYDNIFSIFPFSFQKISGPLRSIVSLFNFDREIILCFF